MDRPQILSVWIERNDVALEALTFLAQFRPNAFDDAFRCVDLAAQSEERPSEACDSAMESAASKWKAKDQCGEQQARGGYADAEKAETSGDVGAKRPRGRRRAPEDASDHRGLVAPPRRPQGHLQV